MVDDMDGLAATDDVAGYYATNIAFHDAVLGATKNAALLDSYKRIIKQLHLYRRRGLVQSGNLHASNAEHRRIVDAVRDRDKTVPAAAMRAHVLAGWARLSAVT